MCTRNIPHLKSPLWFRILLAWQPHSYSLRIIEATQQAIITKECNQRQIETIPPNPLSQEQLELAVITRDISPSSPPLKVPYHQTLQLIFSFYKVWRDFQQHNGTYQVMLVTAVSLHPDLLPDQDVCLPLGHDWLKNIKMAKDAPPLAAAWNVTTLHSMRACSLPKLISQVILDSPAESFSFRHEDSSIFHKF